MTPRTPAPKGTNAPQSLFNKGECLRKQDTSPIPSSFLPPLLKGGRGGFLHQLLPSLPKGGRGGFLQQLLPSLPKGGRGGFLQQLLPSLPKGGRGGFLQPANKPDVQQIPLNPPLAKGEEGQRAFVGGICHYILLLLLIACMLLSGASLSAAASWNTLQLPHFYVHYQEIDTKIAQSLAAKAGSIYQTIVEDVGYAPPRKTDVYLCPTPETFRLKQPSQAKLPDWAAGVAYPYLNRIVMRSALTRDEQGTIKPVEIFKHEFAHIVLEQALAKRGGAPRWLSEGFSMYHARQWTLHGQRTIEEATLRETFIPLRLLTTRFPVEEKAARLAYAQSFSLVAFILNTYGSPVFQRFIANLKQGMETDTALRHAAGVNLIRLEAEWQASLKSRYSWFSYLANIGLFWFALSVVFLIVYLVKRWKVRQIHRQWEEEEEEELYSDHLC